MSQVLALKYRPSNFEKLIGQDAIVTTLSSALSQNRLSHAYLFSGLRGSGKTSTARIFAKALVCDEGPTKNPCEVCPNCIMANENRHIDIIEMDAASSRKIDDIRELIEKTRYKPTTARFKVFIIDEVHMLTREAFNALLKTLEEPPEFIKFILATTDPMKLPATILSRTQHFRFKQISRGDTVKHLEHILNLEGIKYEREALEIIARAGNGSLRDTLTLLDQAIIFSKNSLTPSLAASMLGLLDPEQVKEIFACIMEGDRKRALEFLKELEHYECGVVIDEMTAYLKDRYFEQNDPKFTTRRCEWFFRVLSEAKNLLYLNPENSFVLALVFFKMMEVLNIDKIDDLIASLESEKTEFAEPKKDPIAQIAADIKSSHVQHDESGKIKFKTLVEKLTDRNMELGECFEKNVEFVEFKNNELHLNSHAMNGDRKIIREGYGIIRQFTWDIFGLQTKLAVNHTGKEKEEQERAEAEAKEAERKAEAEKKRADEMIEKDKKQELLNTDFVQKAINLFGDKKDAVSDITEN
ncbi:MAG: DNA polymerase III subunit gamma/tau [Campylobacteraceae bacterium]|nr:DNA polymerase III subunit gamma/tau [Campylobacteraceae bacterium]